MLFPNSQKVIAIVSSIVSILTCDLEDKANIAVFLRDYTILQYMRQAFDEDQDMNIQQDKLCSQ
jgi:hypothetical protein